MKKLEDLLSKGYTLSDRHFEAGDTIAKNEVVLHSDGYLEGYLEARPFSKKYDGFIRYDENGDHEDRYERKFFVSTTVLNKPKRKARPKKKQADTSKMKEIRVEFETEKAYAVYDGHNGKITDPKVYYKFYAKSICVKEDGKVFAPVWA